MSLIQIFTLLSVLSPALAVPARECIGRLYEKCERENPRFACAVFSKEPEIPEPTFTQDWIKREERCSYSFGSIYYIVAIPKNETGWWIKRNGDGGFDNWRYDPYAFYRNNNQISLMHHGDM
ncbi:hypothetical protein DSO57_1005931 [Entomophthora muscae]|uniref:Uncharacterized protein n=1 Tax=Entomophthora muscae TaxID=34485 RepID=A0ACC2RYQ2_9FUNG|nr:hypothetical protein DSO57_1005931 [Entomophthora muscae]